uniref:Uncharacterized protein n=1 Tax=Glossina brevipalpis TaxID=37001 RepID=A0A1A9X2I1_9MUSC
MDGTWIHCTSGSPLPAGAVCGGHDCDGSPIYVGRSSHEGDNLPAKVVPCKGCAYVCWGGAEHIKNHYEILVGHGYTWRSYCGGQVPPSAVKSGMTRTGEPLYIGRGHHSGSLCVGKVHPSHGCLYIPFGGQEVRLDTYEVLVHELSDRWVPSAIHCPPRDAVVAGHDSDSAVIYVGRAMHEGEMLPAKFIPSKNCVYISHRGHEYNKTHFEVLCGHHYAWLVPTSYHHNLPANAVSCGFSHNGEPLYIGRGAWQGSLTPGRISVSQHCLFIPYGGQEIRLNNYEILVKHN